MSQRNSSTIHTHRFDCVAHTTFVHQKNKKIKKGKVVQHSYIHIMFNSTTIATVIKLHTGGTQC